MVSIKGIQKTSLIDYPPYIVSTIFLDRCNFRCGFCHNPDLVLNPETLEEFSEQEILDYLKDKKKWIEGICITGGEPTLHKDLPEFIKKVKELDMKVKLDTNGTNPEMVKELLKNKLVDYIAMDLKTNVENYENVTKTKVDKEKIKESIKTIMQSGIDYCFRSTVLPKFHSKEIVEKMGEDIKDAKLFIFQEFNSNGKMIDDSFKDEKKFTSEEFEELKEIMKSYVKKVE